MSARKIALMICLGSLAISTTAHAEQLPTAFPEEVGMSAERLSRIDDVMRRRVDEGQLGGLDLLAPFRVTMISLGILAP
jgi:hypothetical protein